MLVKLADRIANLEYGMATDGKNDMYSKEFPDFFTSLFIEATPTHLTMWNYVCNKLNNMVKK